MTTADNGIIWKRLTGMGVLAAVAALCGMLCVPQDAQAADDFVTAVTNSKPAAYFRLESPSGKGDIGGKNYQAMGGVSAGAGAPIGVPGNQAAAMNGSDGWITTTQSGGIGAGGTMMAWVNLAGEPARAPHIYYVMGESQSGNDFDLQFESDGLKFYTSSGSHLTFAPPAGTLVNQWHMIVVTMDGATRKRVIYWDGKVGATDTGDIKGAKTSALSIGESTVFRGRYFNGSIDEVALWNRALTANEIAAVYAAAKVSASSSSAPGGARGTAGLAAGGAMFPFNAKVEVEDAAGPVSLKREEQVAIMFLSAIEGIELNCQLNLKRACSLAEMLSGATGPGGQKLKYDPRTDPNYTYMVGASSSSTPWEVHATAKKPGLIGFYYFSMNVSTNAFYNPSGMAGLVDKQLTGRSIEGDTFAIQ